ncbi:MAG: hypothetical protein IJC71_01100 [Clostridia bacterium]|nr:hypothetical protein [Clostridia bacterium]
MKEKSKTQRAALDVKGSMRAFLSSVRAKRIGMILLSFAVALVTAAAAAFRASTHSVLP